MTTWALVELRGDGLWYTISTSTSPTAKDDYTDWMIRNPRRYVQLRQVTSPDQSIFSDQEEQEMAESRVEAATRDGREFGRALYELCCMGATPNKAAAFAVGKRFSRLMGYTDLDTGIAFIEGFTQGYGYDSPKHLTEPTDQAEQ